MMPTNEAKAKHSEQARAAALSIARSLIDAGFIAYFAGGCVRDRQLKLTPEDFDVATDATPEEITSLFANTIGVGASFGVMLVRADGMAVEVSTFRIDGAYRDGRRPESVEFGGPEQDAKRRDFTINAMFEEPITGKVIDYDFVNGRRDIDNKLVRAVGDPNERFVEDHLRLLRAVRFAARFGFSIEDNTAIAMRAVSADLQGVSRERIGGELKRMLAPASRSKAVELLESFELDAPTLGETTRGHGAASPILGALGEVPCKAMTALAAWLLDRHGQAAIDRTHAMRDALTLSNNETVALRETFRIREHLLVDWHERSVAARKRLAAATHFDEALQLVASQSPSCAASIREDVEHLGETGISPTPLVTGEDLIAAGLTPGPMFKQILDQVYDAQLEGTVSDHSAACALALSLVTMTPRDGTTKGNSNEQ